VRIEAALAGRGERVVRGRPEIDPPTHLGVGADDSDVDADRAGAVYVEGIGFDPPTGGSGVALSISVSYTISGTRISLLHQLRPILPPVAVSAAETEADRTSNPATMSHPGTTVRRKSN
jgi:hypothetical protein